MNLLSLRENPEAEAMAPSALVISEADLPIHTWRPNDVLALIIGSEGSVYRPAGAGMLVRADGSRTGNLSAGCIDADIALHCRAALCDGKPRLLRYGLGSPFHDLKLPCGGGSILLCSQIFKR